MTARRTSYIRHSASFQLYQTFGVFHTFPLHPQLLSTAGYIRQSSAGVFHILPLCQRVLDKMALAVRQEMAAVGACQLTMPTLVRDALWKQTGG